MAHLSGESALTRLFGPLRLPATVAVEDYVQPSYSLMAGMRAYRRRWKRRRYMARALWKARELRRVAHRAQSIAAGDILCFVCIRNEAQRLPYFLKYHRKLGVRHFLIVDNASTDGGPAFLADEVDVSLWSTDGSYRASRFGMDWINILLARYGSGHWCLTLDADELFDYPRSDTHDLYALTANLDAQGRESYGAMMLDLYPKGALGLQPPYDGGDPVKALPWFDSTGYRTGVQPRLGGLWIQGGPRDRIFFRDSPRRAPTMNKVPLVRWHWRYVYANAAHVALPARLNDLHQRGNGLLLHTKFLPGAPERARVEKHRGEHFGVADRQADYYDAVIEGPDLWHEDALRYEGWRQAAALGLISDGTWV